MENKEDATVSKSCAEGLLLLMTEIIALQTLARVLLISFNCSLDNEQSNPRKSGLQTHFAVHQIEDIVQLVCKAFPDAS